MTAMTQRLSGSSKGTKAPGAAFGLLVLTLIGLLVTSGVTYGQPTTSTGPVEPKAGTWKTWVLTSGSELRPPAPPANADTQATTHAYSTPYRCERQSLGV